jgi:hypothetical protein
MLLLTYSPFSLSYVALPIDSVFQARTLNQTTNVTIHISSLLPLRESFGQVVPIPFHLTHAFI